MNSNPELNWESVTKGRRSRKSVARSLNSVLKVGSSTSPKRVGDFSGSDSDKFGEMVHGQSTSEKSENVPLKKRRHLLQSPSPLPWASSLSHQDYASPRTLSSSPSCEDHEQLQHLSCSSGDFSGIELLAAAASMDDDTDNADKNDVLLEDSLMPKSSDASNFAALSKIGLKNNESENSASIMNVNVHGGNVECSNSEDNNFATVSKSLCWSPEEGTVLKSNRQHWDLNTLMDAWDEPCDDVIAGGTSKDIRGDMHMEGSQKGSKENVYSNTAGRRDESSYLKIEESKSTSVTEDRICSEPASLEDHLQEIPKSIYSNEISNKACEKNPDRNSIQILDYDVDVKNSNEVTSSDVIRDSYLFTKLCCSSGILMLDEKNNTFSGAAAITPEEYCSSNVSECERSIAPEEVHTRGQDVDMHDWTASESVIDVQHKVTENSLETSGPPGNLTQDVQNVLIADSNKQTDGTCASSTTIADCQGYVKPAVLDVKHEDINYSNERSKPTIMEGACKNCSTGAEFVSPTTSVDRIGCPMDSRPDSDVNQDNQVHIDDGDDLTGFQEGYDSPYEDGELRGSFLCSWKDNEMENECVDYESDGRNGDGSDAADYPGSDIVEGGSKGSEDSRRTRRSLSVKISPEGKSGPVKHSLRKHFVKDDSDNNKIAGKGSNAGSGTTVEQCMEMVMEENHDFKRRQSMDRRDTVDVKVTHIDEYVSEIVRGKLQSRIEGRSYVDATDEKDAFFMQQCRPHRLGGSYTRPERDISSDRYLGRYRSTTHGERGGVHQWTSWGSQRRYTSNYQGAEGRNHTRPRSTIGESADRIDVVDLLDPRPTANYLSKGFRRPLVRRSPVERDEYFSVGRRLPLTRGVSNYRSRGHYSQRAGRGFMENFELLPDDTGASGRMPPFFSRREITGRSAHMTLSRRRSRSRSRSRSPRAWHSRNHRERILCTRRHSRSPEFRTETRMERKRLPFSKPTFAFDYREGYISPTRGRLSPQRNSQTQWVDDRNLADNHIRHRSPAVFRRTQRFDTTGSSGRLKSDENFRSVSRPGRSSFMANGGRECKIESNYDDRRRDGFEMMHRVLHSDDAGNVRRFRHNAADDFETNNLNIKDDVRVTDLRVVPQTQGEREDKREYKI